jgi:beta-lactamase superfamily II metal-dependent hydrolase
MSLLNTKQGLATLLGCLAFSMALVGQDLQIHVINVGWGMSVLVEGPTGKSFLLDGGDVGKGTSKVVPYLQAKSISKTLDAIVLSHNHADHAGGLAEINSAGFKGTKNYYNGSVGGSSTALNWVSSVGATAMVPGTVLDLGGGATATCVVANGTVIGQTTQPTQADENDNSIALVIRYGGFSYLWEGDLGGAKDSLDTCSTRTSSQVDMEVPMINAISYGAPHALLPAAGADVIQVGHHGSESSSHPVYVKKTAPQVAIISVGQGQSGTWALPYTQTVDGVLLSGVSGCAGVAAPLLLQTEDGDQNYNNQRSTSGYAVGNVVVRTDGAHFWVSCNSDNADVPYIAADNLATERQGAGIPLGTEREFTCKGSSSNTVVATITSPTSSNATAGTAIAFAGSATDSSNTATLTYAWDFADGSKATGASASHTFAATGTYPVTFTATDNTGAFNAATKTMTVNSGGSTLTETFELGSKTGYAAGNVTETSGVWTLTNALIGTSSSDAKDGAKSVRVENGGIVAMNFDFPTGAKTVTLKAASYGSDASSTWGLFLSTNGGSTWTQVGSSVTTSSKTLATSTFTVNVTGAVRFEVKKLDTASTRVNIDDFQINGY